MAHHVEVELRPGELGSIEVCHEDALLAVVRSSQHFSQRAYNATAAADQLVLRSREPFGRIAGRKISSAQELTGREHEATTFERDVADSRKPRLAVVDGDCSTTQHPSRTSPSAGAA